MALGLRGHGLLILVPALVPLGAKPIGDEAGQHNA